MKRFFLIAVGIVLLMIAVTEQPLKAQIYGEYDTVKVVQPSDPIGYIQLTSPSVISAIDFKKPSAPNLPPTIVDRDNGYYKAQLGFSFEYNGEVYSEVWVCVNGFVTFSQPVYVESTDPEGLFKFGSSYQINVIAPYWGNHFLVTAQDTVAQGVNRHLPGQISYKTEGVEPNRVFTVQWKNLYINLQTPLLPGQLPPLKNGIGNFQVKLYECPDPYSRQGDIEFCYGQVEGNPYTTEDQVITRDATVGIKGETNVRGSFADFMNALYFDQAWTTTDDRNYSPDSTRIGLKKTNAWQPSGGSDTRIHYYALARFQAERYWGDGDADMSKLLGRKHGAFGETQNRYVTFNDARVIVRSVVTMKQLDSVRRRSAYHGDVNHDGRYFYRDTGIIKSKVNPLLDSLDPNTGDPVQGTKKTALDWKNVYYGDSLSYVTVKDPMGIDTVVPTKINTLKMVFFMANEQDAAWILEYMKGSVESLPWLLDTTVRHGKIGINEDPATNIIAGMAERLEPNKYIFPVYLNGVIDGPLSFRFDVNGKVTGVTVDNQDGNILTADYENNIAALAGSGSFQSDVPIAIVTVTTDKPELLLSNIRFRGIETGRQTIYLTDIEETDNNGELLLQNQPNPFTSRTVISLNIADEGMYRIAVYDALGNKVRTLFNGSLNAGPYALEWDGTDDGGNALSNGAYIYRLTGQNVSASRKLMLNK
ncbi:MAG: hypothetical protein A2X61_14530 [Ignavibacteria bacterium GWB2_35_12]|nr:MAG: hypothetical protein A2X63_04665 [Ignavibacteria bacterium GWA2_35_8]OGU41116.1 MAG: hypothetical protein A2X61_14530 [Ignavibacteria bacterium GWB2_35_12]OGU97230.1 MAG: hypothetical protein A2220_06020 [Ignavibacteria bacterium RIFOXYA2_FULL_35_10]OGV22932.1 MAG: hypothetical protein A2475_10690 [Ignavibacteria bacterium RIFOXYC2_FULL_35_21]